MVGTATMLRLFTLPAFDRSPSLSPFCTKVHTFLRMAGIAYEAVSVRDVRGSPKGKLPYIDDAGRRLGDSGFILEYLTQSRGVSLDLHLSAREAAQGHSLRRMLEEHFYWGLVYARWFDDAHWQKLEPFFLGHLPKLAQRGLGAVARAVMRRTLVAHGIGRHARDEILALAKADLTTAALLLEDRSFLFGERPSSYDAILHAFLSSVLDVDLDTPLRRHALQLGNLANYSLRMTARFYPELAARA